MLKRLSFCRTAHKKYRSLSDMKTPGFYCYILAVLAVGELFCCIAPAQQMLALAAPPTGTIVALDPRAERTWAQLVSDLHDFQSLSKSPGGITSEQGKKNP